MTGVEFGLSLPQYGPQADPTAVAGFAAAAEELGFASLWVADRVLAPVSPSDLYPGGGTPEQPYPPEFTRFADPLVTLTVAATATTSVRLGTCTITGTLHPPLLLARSLTTIDLLSRGRLDVGIGIGWLRDEYTATGVPWQGRGRRLEELLDVLATVWTADPVAHEGRLWRIPESTVDLRPARRPHPPVLLGGFSPATFERAGRRADGWLPAALPARVLREQRDQVRAAAERAGRDPDRLRCVMRANPVPGTPLSKVAARVAQAREIGLTEAFADLHRVARDPKHALDLGAELLDLVRRG